MLIWFEANVTRPEFVGTKPTSTETTESGKSQKTLSGQFLFKTAQ